MTCADMLLRQTGVRNEVYILSDSQSAIKALCSTTITSNTVWSCLLSLKKLSRRRKVHIMWIPGHEGHEGNEEADRLAKQGAVEPYIGPEPACDIPKSTIN